MRFYPQLRTIGTPCQIRQRSPLKMKQYQFKLNAHGVNRRIVAGVMSRSSASGVGSEDIREILMTERAHCGAARHSARMGRLFCSRLLRLDLSLPNRKLILPPSASKNTRWALLAARPPRIWRLHSCLSLGVIAARAHSYTSPLHLFGRLVTRGPKRRRPC